MRSRFLVLSLVLMGGMVAQAQVVQRPSVVSGGQCPVELTARQSGSGQTMWTVALEDQKDVVAAQRLGGMGVAVELKAGKEHTIREALFEVSYVLPRTRVLMVAGDASGDVTAKKTFSLEARGEGSVKLVGDLLVGRAAMIERVRVVSLKCADGGKWEGRGCSVEPSRVVLVGMR